MSRFIKPTVEELVAYSAEIGFSGFDAGKFFDYYETCGWIVGKGKPMKDWRAAVRNWRRMAEEYAAQRGAATVEADPVILDYARQALRIIREQKGYDIGRFYQKVLDAVGPDGLRRVRVKLNEAKANP